MNTCIMFAKLSAIITCSAQLNELTMREIQSILLSWPVFSVGASEGRTIVRFCRVYRVK